MKTLSERHIELLMENYLQLMVCKDDICTAVDMMARAIKANKKIITCGNGGSAADAIHIVGELMKSFVLKRKISNDAQKRIMLFTPEHGEYLIDNLQEAIPAMSLLGETALMTAYANDQTSNLGFAQQLWGIGNEGDVLWAVSTSGNSENILYACEVAKIRGMQVVGMTGNTTNKLETFCDVAICAPSDITYRIQEYHLPIYHAICLALENELFGE